jgi:cellulose synthase/poly-beta-1,6-N-acetylglucosamine synthase-like glycosyltransferase
MVSILIAARNEETHILECLQSLARLDYPPHQLEILIGDDNSTDGTADIVRNFIRDKPHFHYHRISRHLGQARGKANVLAHLARQARGEVFLITDADTQVPPAWVRNMAAARTENIGVAGGVTVPQVTSLWTAFQALDWIQAFGCIRLLSRFGVPVAAPGNNMLLTREAYEATGGYENLPFSISEDHQIFREVVGRGYGFRQLFGPGIAVETHAMPNLPDLMAQRKRWMNAALQTPRLVRLLTVLPLALLPVILASFLTDPSGSLATWAVLLGLQAGFAFGCAARLRLRGLYKYVPLYPVYFHLATFATLIHFLLPTPVRWKGRDLKYDLRNTKYEFNSEL